MRIKALTGAVLALALGLGGLAFAGPAQAHTPTVSSTCEALTVDLNGFETGAAGTPKVPEIPAVTHMEYEFVHHDLGNDNSEKSKWEKAGWNADTNDHSIGWTSTGISRIVTEKIAVAAIPGTEAETNTIKVTVDGKPVTNMTFDNTFTHVYTFSDKFVAHTYTMQVTAWEGPNGFTTSGTSSPCSVTTPSPEPTTTIPAPIVVPSPTTAPRVDPAETPKLVLWGKPADAFGPQHLVATADTADLNALDGRAVAGSCYQADLYHPGEITNALIEGGVLISPNHPREDLLPGGDGVAHKTWCIPAPVVPIMQPCESTSGGTATDLNANGWTYGETKATGHNDYVAGGLNVYTEGATSTDKAAGYHAVGLPLGKIGVPSMLLANISGGHPGLQLGVDRDGDGKWDGYLVNEGDTYGAGKWWTSKPGFGVASGDGYESLGTLNQYFAANPKAVVLSVGYSLGSGVLGNVVIKSITAGCKTYTFDLAATPVVPEPKVVVTSSGTPDCKAGTVAIITTTTTTGIFALQGKVLVAKPDTVVPVTTTRDATIKECPAVVVVPPTSPISADPELPTFTDAACTDSSESTTPKYTIPTTKGVQYQQSSDGIKFTDVEKGSYTVAVGSKIWVKPVAQPGYVLKSSTVSKHPFSAAEDCQLPPLGLLTPMASSTRITCDTAGSYTVVNDEGLIWLVDGVEKPAGTYVVSQPSTVRVVATTDPSKAGLEANAQTEWMFTFTKPICQLTTLALPGSNGTLAFTGSNGKLASGLLLGLIFMIVGAGAMTVNHVRRRTN